MRSNNKQKALQLRLESGYSVAEVATAVGVSPSTASVWLRGIPLGRDRRKGGNPKKDKGPISKHFASISDIGEIEIQKRKPKVAEAAVLFRLALHGFDVMKPAFDGSRVDWLVEIPGSRSMKKIQVKSTRQGPSGLPVIRTRCYDGYAHTRPYELGECDYLVGYDLKTDIAYVFVYEDVRELRTVSIREDAAERWDLIK